MSGNGNGNASSPATHPQQNRCPYPFDATPKFVKDLVRDGRAIPMDGMVLDVLLGFRKRVLTSCWCSVATIAARLGVSHRTVQRSFKRLGRAGVIEQRPVASPDPDEPGNRTGWRICFLWLMPPDYVPGPGPIRAGLRAAKWPPGMTPVSPPPGVSGVTPVSPPPVTSVSPKHCACAVRIDGLEIDVLSSSSLRAHPHAREGQKSDDDDVRCAPGGENPPIPKVATCATHPITQATAPAELPAGAADAIALAAANPELGAPVADQIRAEASAIGRELEGRWDWFVTALCVVILANRAAKRGKRPVSIGNPVVYAMSTAWRKPGSSYRAKDGPDEAGRQAEAEVRRGATARAASVPRPSADQIAIWLPRLDDPATRPIALSWFERNGLDPSEVRDG